MWVVACNFRLYRFLRSYPELSSHSSAHLGTSDCSPKPTHTPLWEVGNFRHNHQMWNLYRYSHTQLKNNQSDSRPLNHIQMSYSEVHKIPRNRFE